MRCVIGTFVALALMLGVTGRAGAALTLEAQETTGSTVNATLIAQDGAPPGKPGVINFFGGGTTSTTVPDSSVPGGSTTPDGTLTLPVNLGNFSMLGSVSTSNSPGGALAQLKSSLLSLANTSAVAHTVTFVVSDTGFTGPVNPALSGVASGAFNGLGNDTAGDTVHAQAFADFNNVLFGKGTLVQDFNFASPGGDLQFYSNPSTFPGSTPATPYSLTVEMTFNIAGGNELSSMSDSILGNPSGAATPEPSSFILFGMALTGLGVARWRKRKQVA